MVEAAMVIPFLIWTAFAMMLMMVYFYTCHYNQILLHRELIEEVQNAESSFTIEERFQENQKKVEGLSQHFFKSERQYRVYVMKPARWILLGESVNFDDG